MGKLEKFRNKKFKNLNKEIYTPMKFDIEQKSNRDTFNNFYSKEKIIHNNNDYVISNNESFSSKDSDVKDGTTEQPAKLCTAQQSTTVRMCTQ